MARSYAFNLIVVVEVVGRGSRGGHLSRLGGEQLQEVDSLFAHLKRNPVQDRHPRHHGLAKGRRQGPVEAPGQRNK